MSKEELRREEQREFKRLHRLAFPEIYKQRYLRDRKKRAAACKRWREKNPDKYRSYSVGARRRCLVHYGGKTPKCNCCGETEYTFLVLDHPNDDGSEERKKAKGGGFGFYCWLIRNNFPSKLQVLCHNCNWGRRVFGKCPHKT